MGECIFFDPWPRLKTPISVFLDKMFTFFSLGLVLYGIAQLYGFLSKDSIIKNTVKCPYCRKSISEKVYLPAPCEICTQHLQFCQALRCVNCTSWVDGREERETTALATQ